MQQKQLEVLSKKHLGTIGFAGIYSFNGNKIITSGGGGAIVSNNKKFIQKSVKNYRLQQKENINFYFFTTN